LTRTLACLLLLAATPALADNCDIALTNLNAMQASATQAIETAGKIKRGTGSAKKLAVLEASRAQGYYMAMQSMLPLACKGERYTNLDKQLTDEIPKMKAYVEANW
jgi:hypothetical protein